MNKQVFINVPVAGLSKSKVCDTTGAAEVLFSLTCENRREVDDLVAKAVAAGGVMGKAEDFGFMYTHSLGSKTV